MMVVERLFMRCWMPGGASFITGNMWGGGACREALLREDDLRVAVGGGMVAVCEAKVAEALAELGPRVVGRAFGGGGVAAGARTD